MLVMRIKTIICKLCALLVLGLTGCEDIFEANISEKKVILLTPADSIVSHNLNIRLQWEELDGAREYRLRIASPLLQKPDFYYLDTVILKNTYNVNLPPGNYQWQVQGRNAGYTTAFETRSFIIDSSATLNNISFNLLAPLNGSVTKNSTITFKWDNVSGASKYLFQIISTPHFDTIVYTNEFKKKFVNTNLSYTWKVTALNALSLKESITQQFSIDTTVPLSPELRFPSIDTSFLLLPISLSWTRKVSDVAFDSIYIFNSQMQLLPNFPKKVNSSKYLLTSTDISSTPGTYFWGIKSIDQAGNSSQMTGRRRFMKQ